MVYTSLSTTQIIQWMCIAALIISIIMLALIESGQRVHYQGILRSTGLNSNLPLNMYDVDSNRFNVYRLSYD